MRIEKLMIPNQTDKFERNFTFELILLGSFITFTRRQFPKTRKYL